MLVKGMGFCNYLLVRISCFVPAMRTMEAIFLFDFHHLCLDTYATSDVGSNAGAGISVDGRVADQLKPYAPAGASQRADVLVESLNTSQFFTSL